MKIKLVNNSLVPIGGKLPNAVFSVEAINSTTPKDQFWRNRLSDDDGIQLVSKSEPKAAPKQEPKPEKEVARTDPASRSKVAPKSDSKGEVSSNE